jgi:hypothetical protein
MTHRDEHSTRGCCSRHHYPRVLFDSAWCGLGCVNYAAFNMDREGLVLRQVVNEDLVERVKHDEVAARVPEEVAASRQEIDSRLEDCAEENGVNSQHDRDSYSPGNQARKKWLTKV